jgi:LacI family transcriptional regulator
MTVPSRVTSHDIAREAGVSQSTVSRALRGDPRVAPETLERVREVARSLQYAPNAAARSLITRQTNTVAVIVTEIKNPFYPQLLDTLHDELTLSGYRTVLLNERSDIHTSEGLVPEVQRGSVDGVVCVSLPLATKLPRTLAAHGLAVVLLNRTIDDPVPDRVVSDNVAGAGMAAQELLALGHRRIATIAGPKNSSTGRDRDRGFRAGLERAGHLFDERYHRTSDYSHQGGYQWGVDLLRQERRPTAIFCANDVVAFGVLDAAKALGLAVPGDVSVIGYDDIEMASWEVFGLTTVRQPLEPMAKSAARLLLERMEEPRRETRMQVFPVGLVRRSTTGPVPPGHDA